MKIKNVFFFLTGLVSLVSCLNPDKTKDLSLEINTSLPLGNYYLNDRELFEQTALKNTVVEDEQGQLSIQESTESILMDQTKMNKLFVLENQSIDHQYFELQNSPIYDRVLRYTSKGARFTLIVLKPYIF